MLSSTTYINRVWLLLQFQHSELEHWR